MDRFQIIIPMSGQGSRFKDAGFKLPKPLINVAGKPIIAYVIDLFPKETNFIFICNQDHLNNKNYKMRDIILKYCPTTNLNIMLIETNIDEQNIASSFNIDINGDSDSDSNNDE